MGNHFKNIYLPVVALFRQLAAEDPSIPEEILAAWKNAVQSKSKNAKSALFNAFLKAGKNWGQLLGLRFVHALHVMELCIVYKHCLLACPKIF